MLIWSEKSLQFEKPVKHGDDVAAIPSVADGLKIVVRRRNVAVRLFRFHVKFHVAKIRREIKGLIRAVQRNALFPLFGFDFLFVGIVLLAVVYVPSKRIPKFVEEIRANFVFFIVRAR